MLKKSILLLMLTLSVIIANAQGPEITSWLLNTNGVLGRHYLIGNLLRFKIQIPQMLKRFCILTIGFM